MPENPYSPPKSEVRDRALERAIAERPRQVLYAVVLLWVSLVLGMPTAYHEHQKAATDESASFVLIVMAVVYAFEACLNVFAARGYNWARIVLLIFSSIAAVSFLATIKEYLEDPVVYFALDASTLVMDAVALYLLFSKPGALWFRRIH
jgi:hypothetical protein